jgi:hypothetical protein
MPRMRASAVRVALAGLVVVGLGMAAAAADRQVAWVRSGYGRLEGELNTRAGRGFRVAAVSDGLASCSIVAMQQPEKPEAGLAYRVVADKDLATALDGLVADGFVPRAMVQSVGTRREVIFERMAAKAGSWRLVEFAAFDRLEAALAGVAADGYRARVFVRPALKSWPGLSHGGMVLAERSGAAGARETRVWTVGKKNVDDLTRDVLAATKEGWQFDLLFTQTRSGDDKGRRERAAVVLSRPTGEAPPVSVPVRVERDSSFGMRPGHVVGAAAYWDEYFFATVEADRHQTWSSPLRLGSGDADCGPLGFGFRFDAPRDSVWDVTGLLARPASTTGDVDLVVLTETVLGFRRPGAR